MKKQFDSRTADKFVVRLPDGLRAQVEQSAGTSDTSMNTVFIQALRQYLDNQSRQQVLLDALAAAYIRAGEKEHELNDREGSRRDWFDEAQRLQAELAERDALLRELLDCPQVIETATIPRGGIEQNPSQVVVTLHVGLLRLRKVQAALSASAEPSTKPCEHKWTDDGEFLLVCTACGAQEDHNPGWRDMESAPRDGTMLRLLVEFEEHSTEDEGQAPTIGANNFDNDEIDEWKFAGWCWTHDHFVEGKGTPVGWLPMLDSKATEPAPRVERDERIAELTNALKNLKAAWAHSPMSILAPEYQAARTVLERKL
ncbi:Arc family DNA-binding protein [Pseudomonas protegens]|uniref:Arc family DNA-binding protein n=1 Tax=Pseudomonas protegens TaxID=380021 RepID=UPI001C6324CF|nr:Arc family DNA-binding protein [Pseudomonas protegens]